MKAASRIILVTGGARSGKSALAERLVSQFAMPRIYIATAHAGDKEMSRRIALHRERRGPGWQTVEESHDLPRALARTEGQGVRLIDCLTLWLAAVTCPPESVPPEPGQPEFDPDPAPRIARLCAALQAQVSPVILVTNELGMGIVPENALARRFRDAHGLMNQAVATIADQVWMSVSGLPLRLKPEREGP